MTGIQRAQNALLAPSNVSDMLVGAVPSERQSSFTADELWDAQFPAVEWVVPDLITPGLTLLVGAPKLGKSWLALDICNAVASGGHTLGDRHCQHGSVCGSAWKRDPVSGVIGVE